MRIKFNDKIYRLKEIESGVDSLMELVEDPKYKHGDFLMTRYKFAFIFDREGENGEAHHLFCTDMDGEIRSHMQDRKEGVKYCGYLKDASVADQKATKAIHDGLKSIGKRWNADKKCIEDIPKPKFKVGDKVRIKYGISNKTHEFISPGFTSTMDKFIGKELTVKGYRGGFAVISEDYYGYYFNEDWLEPYTEKLKKGDLAIFWDHSKEEFTVRRYEEKAGLLHRDILGHTWLNAVRFESKDQLDKILKGQI